MTPYNHCLIYKALFTHLIFIDRLWCIKDCTRHGAHKDRQNRIFPDLTQNAVEMIISNQTVKGRLEHWEKVVKGGR